MFITNLRRIFRSGFYSFWRNSFVSLSSVLIMIITLSVICSVLFLGAILKSSLEGIQSRVDINVYFVSEATETDILKLKGEIEHLQEVSSITYVSKEQALINFKERHKNDQTILQSLDELNDQNPLSSVLNIKAKEPSQYEGIARFLDDKQKNESISAPSIIRSINYYENKIAIDRLSKIIDSARKLGFGITLVLIVVSILITLNTLRLTIYISREEIGVMRLVGASPLYIRGPFVLIGMMYGIIAGIITLILFYPVTYWLSSTTADFFIGINVFNYYLSNFFQIFGIVMGSGIVIGAISSYLAIMKFLKK